MCANGDSVKQDGRRIAGDPAVHPISIVPAHVPQHLTSHIRALIEEDPPVIQRRIINRRIISGCRE